MDYSFFACIEGDVNQEREIGKLVKYLDEQALSNDIGAIRTLAAKLEDGNGVWTQYAALHGGEVITVGGCQVRLKLPLNCLDELEQLQAQYVTATGYNCSVGVGHDLAEAQRALMAAQLIGFGILKCWTPVVDEILERAGEESATENVLKKGEDHRMFFSQLATNLEDLKHVTEEAHNSEIEAQQARDDLQFQVGQILAEVKNNIPQIETLKNSSPDVYNSVITLLHTVEEMALRLKHLQNGTGEKLLGGTADGMPDTAFDPNELAMGVQDESEHTNDPDVAKEVAKDHLATNPSYYTDLKDSGMEKAAIREYKGKARIVLPIGSQMDTGSGLKNEGKIKIRKPDGGVAWRTVRAGMVMDAAGNPIAPNAVKG